MGITVYILIALILNVESYTSVLKYYIDLK